MGRRKISIEKLDSASQRKVTYHHRYNGICKKARELSIMSDVSILVVAKTTDTGRYNACFEGDRSSRDFILQFLNESNEIKAKSMHSTGEENNAKHLENLKRQVAEIEDRLDRLRPLQKINQLQKIESLEELHEMEKSIRDFNSTSSEDKKMTRELPLPVYEPIVPDPSLHQWQMPMNRQDWEAAEYQAAEYQADVYRAAQWPPPRAHDHEAGPSYQQEFGTHTP
ncbi:MADS-box transcription factor 23 [Carex littledalei]|uniref:MADS-box transcription factor 23 n=1 Tax=Carex littledalei TaxID=544730 RepID=A0A833VTD3_9POAL|nr:MADS-box transcription factor 23 [Carex littledalei]